MSERTTRVVIIGGGPGGYEAALVASSLGADVTVVERDGLGGASVLTDCVPSKALISTADFKARFDLAGSMGLGFDAAGPGALPGVPGTHASLGDVNARIVGLARAQSADILARLEADGVRVVRGSAKVVDPRTVRVVPEAEEHPNDGPEGAAPTEEAETTEDLAADVILVATGTTPRVLPSAQPDGERILTWQHIYDLTELPEEMVVIGSGVTGAELAHAFLGLGSSVTLVSSRDRVLPGEDGDAATVLEDAFRARGMKVLNKVRGESVVREGDRVVVTLSDGTVLRGTHCLLAVGSVPNTRDMGLEEAGVELSDSGHITVDRVSRTSVPGIYAAGDCTGVLPLASVAAMQGRTAMSHALGDAVAPLHLRGVSANIFTDPEIATVGHQQKDIDAGDIQARAVMVPLKGNPRAKMRNVKEGFVKLFARAGSNTVIGGVVVAPQASELIYPIALAVQNRLTVDQMAATPTVYPSLSGSIGEAARRLHSVVED